MCCKINVVSLLTWCCLIVANPTAFAQYFTGAVAQSTGGSGRAAIDQAESIFLNPATLAHARDVSLGVFHVDGQPQKDQKQNAIGVSIVDHSQGTILPASLSYIKNRFHSVAGPTIDEQYGQLSVGKFFYKQVALGISGVYLETKTDAGDKYEQWNGVIGVHWSPASDLGFALVHYHFAHAGADVPDAYRLPKQWGAGVTYLVAEYLRLRGDIVKRDSNNPDREFEYQVGVENLLSPFFNLRVGFNENKADHTSRWSAGVGFISPRFVLDYAFESEQGDAHSTVHRVDLRLPY